MSVDSGNLRKQVMTLTASAGNLRDLFMQDALSADDETKLRTEFQTVRESVEELKSHLGEGEQTTTFADFFSNVGEAFIRAQRKLDEETVRYLKEVADQPHLLPSAFRIPSLSADIKFALERISEERMNVVFYSTGEKAKDLNQQSVKFEIVAAPVPPEARPTGAESWRPPLVLAAHERRTILDTFGQLVVKVKTEKERTAILGDIVGNPDNILIVRGGGDQEFFLFVAVGNDPNNVGAYHLVLSGVPELHVAYAYTRKATTGEERGMSALQSWLAALGASQRKFLNPTR